MRECVHCGVKLAKNVMFCPKCGKSDIVEKNVFGMIISPKQRSCPHCGAMTDGKDRFCTVCGKSMDEAPAAAPLLF